MNMKFNGDNFEKVPLNNEETLVLEDESTEEDTVRSESLDSLYEKENKKILDSRNFKEYKERIKKDVEEKEREADKLVEDLSSIDFNNQEVLLDWLCNFKETQVSGVISDKNKAVDIFNENGYSIISGKMDKNSLEDKEKYARYIVGKALYEIFTDVYSQEINNCVKQWKEKFSGK